MQTKLLPVKLTEDEMRIRGINLASLENQYEDTTTEAKSIAKSFKDSLERLRIEILALTKQLNSGSEYRSDWLNHRLAKRGAAICSIFDSGCCNRTNWRQRCLFPKLTFLQVIASNA